MSNDIYLDKSEPAAWRSLNGFALKVRAATDSAGLPRSAVELLNVRVSQLNGCAYCLDLHSRLALEAGVSAQQLAVLPIWRETELFGSIERAALAVAEAATAPSGPDTRQAGAGLTQAQYSALAWAAIAMNAFNRVSIISNHPVRRR
ncbi:MAG: carboxymuconolactone decarboxylase family protein [Georgenia sp.]